MSSTDDVLVVTDICRHYGAIKAVDDVSLSVSRGARHALIGPNGAGKTTLFGLVAGTVAPTSGRVEVNGRDVTGLDDSRRNRLGVAKTFQHSSLFDHASAVENVFAAVARVDGISAKWWRPSTRQTATWERSDHLLELVGLQGRSTTIAGELSHGERRQLEVALALASDPSLLLLDEPTAGMSAAETEVFTGLVASLPPEVTVVIIEHDLDVVFALASTISVLAQGRLVTTGSADHVRQSSEVQAAYLGDASTEDLFTTGAGHGR